MQALLLEQQDGKTLASVQTLDESRLPEGDVTVDVHWSSLNYKDALAITGKGKIIRNFPMIPGIDFAGTVRTSEDPRFHAGQEVLLTGWGVGENHWGGLAEQARVKGDWLVAMPQGLDARKAMIIGTAGFTAMLCVMALEDAGVRPQDGEIVVTGASGGQPHHTCFHFYLLSSEVSHYENHHPWRSHAYSPSASGIPSFSVLYRQIPLARQC